MKKRILALCCTLGLTMALLPISAAAIENPFSDVSTDSALAEPVMWAYENEITTGTSTTTFDPDKTCTRGQVVTFLWRAKGEPSPSSTENIFTDVATNSAYYTAILWAVEQGITQGNGDGTFSPNGDCTDEHVITFLYRAMGEPNKTGEGQYYDDALLWAQETGLMDGIDFTVGALSPRSDIVTYLYRDAGSPAIEVTDPEAVVYTYNYPEYATPSSTGSLTWQYLAEVVEYLILSDEDTFAVTFTGYTYDELKEAGFVDIKNDALDYVTAQHVDLAKFYYSLSWNYSYGSNTTLTFYMYCDDAFYSSVAEAESDIDVFLGEISDLVTGFYDSGALKETDSDMVKARYLYNWVCDNISYSDNTPNQYNAYTTYTYKEGVCMGYAGLINVLYRTAGIECYGAGCMALHNGEGHTVNYANLDGTWYYIDATFGDTGYNYDKYFAMTRATFDTIYSLDYKWAN